MQELALRLEAERKLLDAQLWQLTSDNAALREQARAQGQQIIADARKEAEAEAERIRRSAELHLRNERDQAYNALRSDIGRLAVQLSERVVGESLSDSQAVGRTVDRFLAELDAQPSRVVPDYVPDSLAGPEGAGTQ